MLPCGLHMARLSMLLVLRRPLLESSAVFVPTAAFFVPSFPESSAGYDLVGLSLDLLSPFSIPCNPDSPCSKPNKPQYSAENFQAGPRPKCFTEHGCLVRSKTCYGESLGLLLDRRIF